jgi:hypothetical protein
MYWRKFVQKMLVKLTQGRRRNHCRQNTYCTKNEGGANSIMSSRVCGATTMTPTELTKYGKWFQSNHNIKKFEF